MISHSLSTTHLLVYIYRVLQLMNVTDARLSQRGCEKLDLALLYFIEQFRKIYIGEQVQRTSKVSFLSLIDSTEDSLAVEVVHHRQFDGWGPKNFLLHPPELIAYVLYKICGAWSMYIARLMQTDESSWFLVINQMRRNK